MTRYMIISFLLAIVGPTLAQGTLKVDNNEMLIGDQRQLSFEAQIPKGAEWLNKDVTLSDTLKSVQTIRASEPTITESATGKLIQKKWIIAAFDTGYLGIPGIKLAIQNNGRIDTMVTPNVLLKVRGVPADSTGLAPIKDIYKEPRAWIDYLWLFMLLAVVGILVGLYFWWKNKKTPVEVVNIVVERPPHELAMDALNELENQQLWQKGHIKSYHSQLTHIFRSYIEKRYRINALESTTEKIRMDLRKVGLDGHLQNKTIELLQLSDMVKFAKANPRVEVHAELMEYVRDFIRTTKFIPSYSEPNEEEE